MSPNKHSAASTLLGYNKSMRYSSIDSMHVPFVEEAVRAFRQMAKDERGAYDKHRRRETKQQLKPAKQTKYILAMIMLAI